ncbi:hypothetical protein IRZ34_02240 [Rhodococcus rhodochrous]|uniref:hypothetical protein n=1 Tax=Rhodococcus rhodochrous TaxID=1829 RepID=UPI00188C4AD3|nr:hypothetical protein [Rhodococcus rhodochrous]
MRQQILARRTNSDRSVSSGRVDNQQSVDCAAPVGYSPSSQAWGSTPFSSRAVVRFAGRAGSATNLERVVAAVFAGPVMVPRRQATSVKAAVPAARTRSLQVAAVG